MPKMIVITDDGMCIASESLTAADYINVTLTSQLNLFRNLVELGQSQEELYDMYNQSASAFLETFAPDLELRPDLTAEAILEKENELIIQKAFKVEQEPDPATLKQIEEAGEVE